jgi:hypothetical protein
MAVLAPETCRAARALLTWGQRDLAARAKVAYKTVTDFEIGARQPYERTLEVMQRAFEDAGLVFIAPVEGVHGSAVAFKWGMEPPLRAPSEGTAAGDPGEPGIKAAWDFEVEEGTDTDIEALLGEQPELNPDMAEMWRADPELWARLSEGGRETLSRSMFGDCRAAREGYFRDEHYAG